MSFLKRRADTVRKNENEEHIFLGLTTICVRTRKGRNNQSIPHLYLHQRVIPAELKEEYDALIVKIDARNTGSTPYCLLPIVYQNNALMHGGSNGAVLMGPNSPIREAFNELQGTAGAETEAGAADGGIEEPPF